MTTIVHSLLLTTNPRGFGEKMVDTHSVLLWKNPADGSTILSQRYADAYAEPHVVESPPRVAWIVEPKGLLVWTSYIFHRSVLKDVQNYLASVCFASTVKPFHHICFPDPTGPHSISRFSRTPHSCTILQLLGREFKSESHWPDNTYSIP